MASPKSGHDESYESMFACGSSVHRKCSNFALTNLLFGLYKSMWVIHFLVNLLNPHPRAPTRPSTHVMLWAREHAPTPFPSTIVTFGLAVESIKELGGASDNALNAKFWNFGTCIPIFSHQNTGANMESRKLIASCAKGPSLHINFKSSSSKAFSSKGSWQWMFK